MSSLLPEIAEALGPVKDALWWGLPAISLPPQEPPGTRHSAFWVLDSVWGGIRVAGKEGEQRSIDRELTPLLQR